jgi:SAM-dependent methyltransferase
MNLAELQQTWNTLAGKDAMWAVLTGPVGSSRRWDPEAFFRTGAEEISSILDRVAAAGIPLRRGRALDFGCGVGRLTQALARSFEQADGVDISTAMVEQARALNQAGPRCSYHVNAAPDLSLLPARTFDFVYSSITLQHIPPEFSRRYIAEFFRVAAPGAAVVFQVPAVLLDALRPRTALSTPLPDEGCRAALTAPARVTCTAGEEIIVPVVVRNVSALVWPALGGQDEAYRLRLGNHWRGGWLGRMLKQDDKRFALPYDLPPGEAVEMGFHCRAPEEPGRYSLELDMVQEGVRWFAWAGSRTARVRVMVKPAAPQSSVAEQSAHMDMYGIPRPEVEALIAAAGGTLVAVDETDSAGSRWMSYRYIAVA